MNDDLNFIIFFTFEFDKQLLSKMAETPDKTKNINSNINDITVDITGYKTVTLTNIEINYIKMSIETYKHYFAKRDESDVLKNILTKIDESHVYYDTNSDNYDEDSDDSAEISEKKYYAMKEFGMRWN